MADKTERPIIFSEAMVKAILDGRKTQTRRVMKLQPECKGTLEATAADEIWYIWPHGETGETDHYCKFPYAHRLWVRENFAIEKNDWNGDERFDRIVWKADRCAQYYLNGIPRESPFYLPSNYEPMSLARWKPSIHMPRYASRLLLDVVRVRVERVQDISNADIRAEGITAHSPVRRQDQLPTSRSAFANLWDAINKDRGFGWDTNPWVWVMEFKKAGDDYKPLDKARWEMEYLSSWEVVNNAS